MLQYLGEVLEIRVKDEDQILKLTILGCLAFPTFIITRESTKQEAAAMGGHPN